LEAETLRHFQATASFARLNEWVYEGDHTRLELRFWVTRSDAAPALETKTIRRLRPTGNIAGTEDLAGDVPF
jgi:hypothetical protein